LTKQAVWWGCDVCGGTCSFVGKPAWFFWIDVII